MKPLIDRLMEWLQKWLWKLSIIETCPACGGDGKETCDNPDHGFIDAIGGETGRLGCPCCGHDPEHKIPKGGDCFLCLGKGWRWIVAGEPFKFSCWRK
jgi:hypothetical protein